MKKPSVTIVICTHQRIELLKGAVQSLVAQTASSETYKVIVVDNDYKPNPEVEDIVVNAKQHISIKYLHENKIGLSHARNAGGKAARSDYIGYMDDDAKANQQYIEHLTKIIHQVKPDICGGPFIPFYLTSKPKWFHDSYGSGNKGNVARYLSANEYLSGMNIVFHRNVLDETGWFTLKLGMSGKKVWYGEETMVMINAWKAHPDLKVYYHPQLYVHHLVPRRKMSLRNHMFQAYQIGRAQVYFWTPETEQRNFRRLAPKRLIFELRALTMKFLPGIIFRDRRRYPYWQNYVYEKLFAHISAISQNFQLIKDLLSSFGRKRFIA